VGPRATSRRSGVAVVTDKLLLDERSLPEGALEKTWLEVDAGQLFLRIDGRPKTLVPPHVLEGVMRRYGKPLADNVALDGPCLEIDGCAVSILRYRPRYDVIAKDYFVYARAGATPVTELATAVTGALAYLLRCGDNGERDR
jgi:hypothetical protein